MSHKYKRIVLTLLTIITIITYIPIDVLAVALESSFDHQNTGTGTPIHDDITNLVKASTDLLKTDNKYKGDLNYKDIVGITPETTLDDIEQYLLSAGFVNRVKSDNTTVRGDYTEDETKHRALIKTELNSSTSEVKTIDTSNSDYNRVLGTIYIKKAEGDLNKYTMVMRYYAYKEEVFGKGPAKNKLISVLNYDLTPIFTDIIEKGTDTSEHPIVDVLRRVYIDYVNIVKNETQEGQQDIWKYYASSSSKVSYAQKKVLEDINTYISSKGSKEVPTLPTDLTFTDQMNIFMYIKAIEKSFIFEMPVEELLAQLPGINLTTNVTEEDIQLPGRKVVDLITAVTSANNTVDKYRNRQRRYTNKGVVSNASLFNDITQYRYGKMSKAEERDLDTLAVDKREIDDRFEDLLVTYENLASYPINPMLWDQRHKVTSISYGIPVQDYLDLFSSIQLLEEYAKDFGKSGIEDNKNMNMELEIENQKDTIDDGPKTIDNAELVNQIKTYIQIREGLNFLGIEPWTEELQYIYDKYDSINGLVLSEDFDLYDETSDVEPLKRFFSYENKTMSSNYLTGVALSATYIPMQTNLYDPTSIRVLKDDNWLRDFHVRYGFNRKALMIDENVNAAVDGYVTGSRDSYRPVVLRDLLEFKKDIVLYVDDNFYNTREVADMTDKIYQRLSNTEQAGLDGEKSFSGFVDNLFNSSIEQVLKTGPKNKYDTSTINKVSAYGKPSKIIDWASMKESLFTDGIIMSAGDGPQDAEGNEIKKGLNEREYSVKQSYAAVSGIYRHKELANHLNTIAERPAPVFVSSPALYNVQNVPNYEFNSIYNYYMLRNLESALGVDYRTTLDLDNPLYIDIYGNILTESGLVVIPAASNATLYPKGTYSTYTLGFMELYSKGDNIKYNKRLSETSSMFKYLNDFMPDENEKYYLQKNYELNGVTVNPQRPSVADSDLINVLYDNQVVILNNDGYDFNQRVWLATEVLRGAPIEDIDKVTEGLQGKRDVDKYGLYMSWKLDEIADTLLPTTNGNSIISMPNLAFMDGIEYLVLFLFKAMLLLFVTYIMYRIYIDAVGARLGLKTFIDCVFTIVTFSICLSAIPDVISLSYNEPNKIFMQDEIKYINLLNYEKSLEGREISAVGVTEPKSQTKLYLKIDEMKVPWYKVLQDVMFAPVGTTLNQLYEDELQEHMLYGFDDVQVVNDGVYIDIEDIFKSSSIIYKYNQKFLYQNMNSTPTASYFTPYYYIMDNLLYSINSYNRTNGIINVTTKIQSDGSVKTMGMIGDYLLSEYFLLEDQDPLGLYEIYNVDLNESKEFINDEYDEHESTKKSMWYVNSLYSPEEIASNIDQIYSHMRSYVASNRHMIGRVTDETFIKTMMLDVSMKYNNVFRIPAAKGIEVFSIDSRDLIRLSISDKNTVVLNASNSFGKFVYDQAGGLGVILTAILLGVYFITSIVKPAMVIFLIALLVYNVLIKRTISMEKGKTVEGLLYVLAILVIVNSTYAILLKLSMSLPKLGMSPLISIIGQIGIQVLYLFFIGIVVTAVLKDLGNFGYNIFHSATITATSFLTGKAAAISSKAFYTEEQHNYMESAKHKSESSDGNKTSSDLREEMEERDRVREQSTEDNAFMDDVFKE